MTDVLLGAVWTLACVLIGALIGLAFVWVFADREQPPDDGGGDTPSGPQDPNVRLIAEFDLLPNGDYQPTN